LRLCVAPPQLVFGPRQRDGGRLAIAGLLEQRLADLDIGLRVTNTQLMCIGLFEVIGAKHRAIRLRTCKGANIIERHTDTGEVQHTRPRQLADARLVRSHGKACFIRVRCGNESGAVSFGQTAP